MVRGWGLILTASHLRLALHICGGKAGSKVTHLQLKGGQDGPLGTDRLLERLDLRGGRGSSDRRCAEERRWEEDHGRHALWEVLFDRTSHFHS